MFNFCLTTSSNRQCCSKATHEETNLPLLTSQQRRSADTTCRTPTGCSPFQRRSATRHHVGTRLVARLLNADRSPDTTSGADWLLAFSTQIGHPTPRRGPTDCPPGVLLFFLAYFYVLACLFVCLLCLFACPPPCTPIRELSEVLCVCLFCCDSLLFCFLLFSFFLFVFVYLFVCLFFDLFVLSKHIYIFTTLYIIVEFVDEAFVKSSEVFHR